MENAAYFSSDNALHYLMKTYAAVLLRVVARLVAACLADAVAVFVEATLTRAPAGVLTRGFLTGAAVLVLVVPAVLLALGLRAGFAGAASAAALLARGFRAGFLTSSSSVVWIAIMSGVTSTGAALLRLARFGLSLIASSGSEALAKPLTVRFAAPNLTSFSPQSSSSR